MYNSNYKKVNTRVCRFCKESISVDSKICPYCKEKIFENKFNHKVIFIQRRLIFLAVFLCVIFGNFIFILIKKQYQFEKDLSEMTSIVQAQKVSIDNLLDSLDQCNDRWDELYWKSEEEQSYDWNAYIDQMERENKNDEMMSDMCLRQGKIYSPSSGICIDLVK